MPRRFTITEKWDRAWFIQLSPFAKLLFLYLADRCDLAGIWEINSPLASLQTGLAPQSLEKAMSELIAEYAGERKIIPCATHLFLCSFIRHQGNLPLNPSNRAHLGIMRSLEKHSPLFGVDLREIAENSEIPRGFEGASKGLPSPYGKGHSLSPGSSSLSEGGCRGETLSGGVCEVVLRWNSCVPEAQRCPRDGTPAIDRAYSGLVLAAPPVTHGEILAAVENYRLALAVPKSQAYTHTLGSFLRREIIERYLPGRFNPANYDGGRFVRARDGPQPEDPQETLKRLKAKGIL